MTQSQFQKLIERLDCFEEKFENRLRRLEIWVATAAGAVMIIGFAVGQGIIRIGN